MRPAQNFYSGMLCGICGHKMSKKEHANIDHIIPRSRGGKNEPENLQYSHRWGNQYKADRLIGEYEKPTFAWHIKCLALYKMGLLRF